MPSDPRCPSQARNVLTDTYTTGSFAALWQSMYRGLVPARSLFSFFQRLGMVWRRVTPVTAIMVGMVGWNQQAKLGGQS